MLPMWEEEENCDQGQLHHGTSRAIWQLLLSLVRVSWVFPLMVKELLLSWCSFRVGKKRRMVWQTTPLCLCLEYMAGIE